MLVIHVHIHVKPDCIAAFKAATIANASASLREPGVVCFNVSQQADDPTRFVLVEAYRRPEDHAAHRTTAHYATWRDSVEPLMAETRRSTKFDSVYPDEANW